MRRCQAGLTLPYHPVLAYLVMKQLGKASLKTTFTSIIYSLLIFLPSIACPLVILLVIHVLSMTSKHFHIIKYEFLLIPR